MSIFKKIIISPILLASLAIGVSAYFFNHISDVIQSMGSEIQHSSTAVERVYRDSIYQLMELTQSISFEPMLWQEPATLNKILFRLKQYKAIQSAYFVDANEKILAEGIPHSDLEASPLVGQPLPSSDRIDIPLETAFFDVVQGQLVYSHPFTDQGDVLGRLQVVISLDQLASIEKGLMQQADHLIAKSQDTTTNTLIVSISIIIVSLLIAVAAIREVIKNLRVALGVVNEVAKGNLDVHCESRSGDETGQLQAAMKVMVGNMRETNNALASLNRNLEGQVKERTQELEQKHQELEQQLTELQASHTKLADLDHASAQFLQTMNMLHESHLHPLKNMLDRLLQEPERGSLEQIREAAKTMHTIEEKLLPYQSLYQSGQAIRNKHVLLAETNKKQQIIAKMALGGTGVELDIVSDIESGIEQLSHQRYDIVCLNADLIELVLRAREVNPSVKSVFMTSEHATSFLPLLREYPSLSNIVSRNEDDRNFTLKNIATTISKLTSGDFFGLEKYLNWGVEVQQKTVIHSAQRENLVEEMETYFAKLGVRRQISRKCGMVAEELLMNAIYDAPTDAQGMSLYNHLSRTEKVSLKPEEQGTFRYACDGILAGLSVSDPFGAFSRTTILDYLESCYQGNAGSLQKNKGGAGRGLFQIMETADLVIWNVKPRIKTEVIALFTIDTQMTRATKTNSFHYFLG